MTNYILDYHTKSKSFCIERTLFFLMYFLISFFSVKSQQVIFEFQLTGTTMIKNKDFVYISYYNNIKQKGINDSCKITDGKFTLRGKISQPAVAFVRLDRSQNLDDQSATIFIEPSLMKFKIMESPFTVDVLSGSKTTIEYDSLQKQQKLLDLTYIKLITKLANTKNNEDFDKLHKELEPYYEKVQKLNFAFIDAHPQSFATGFLLQNYMSDLPVDRLQLYYDAMGKDLQESIYGDRFKDIIQRKKIRKSGSKAPNFSSVTNTNQVISLSDFSGRYVLLDFWAHWCIPCRQSSPDLIKLFNKYHGKGLEIISIADDDYAQDEWKKAIKNDKIDIWYNVLRGIKKNAVGEIDKSKSLNDIYDVSVLPTKILIDQSGIIIGTYKGTEADKKLAEKLQKLFQ